jgi:hypothetical protein
LWRRSDSPCAPIFSIPQESRKELVDDIEELKAKISGKN